MKAKDVALLAVIGVVSFVLSIIVSNMFVSTPEDRSQKVEVVAPISSNFTRPDNTYFNQESNNPTQLIKIGEDQNQQPFGAQ